MRKLNTGLFASHIRKPIIIDESLKQISHSQAQEGVRKIAKELYLLGDEVQGKIISWKEYDEERLRLQDQMQTYKNILNN